MRTSKLPSPINPSFTPPFSRLAPAVALLLALLAGAVNSHAQQTYFWTNTTGSTWDDPGAWNPVGGPGGNSATANFQANGVYDVPLTNNFANNSSILFGAASAGGSLTVTLDFGTNIFSAISGNANSASGFVFGQLANSTATVYISVGTLYCTNAANAPSPSDARLIVGRNGPGIVYLTNGTVVVGNTIIANTTGGSNSKLVISGNSYWTNQANISIGNAVGTVNNSLVISNSASLTTLGTFEAGWEGSSSFNTVLVDSGGQLFTRTRTALIGTGASASNNTMTVQGGSLWDNGNQAITIGNTGGFSNVLTVGSSSTVSNVTAVTVVTGNSLSLSGGLLRTSIGVTNSSGIVSGSGTIVGNVTFTGTGTLSLGTGTSVGTLTFSNNLTLASGSTTILKLDKTQAGSNDLLAVAGTASEAGTLIINNVGPALVGGDTFTILALTSPAGGFIFTSLPSLTGSLIWNTTQLGPQGVISVVLPPTITGPASQAVLTNTDVSISTVVTGVPTPSLQWQLNGVNVTDGPTGNGSTISGSTTPVLTIFNSQTNDSGQYCLIASNFAGLVTNCMSLTVALSNAAPVVTGPFDQNVIVGQNGTFSASVAGIPLPTQQWQQNGVDIPGATGLSISVNNVQFSQDGFVYSIIASNEVGIATNSAVLHAVVPPTIQIQPQSLTVTNTQGACFSVTSTNGVPPPTYQWQFNNVNINGATNATYCIASVTPANAGAYHVTVANIAGSVTSTNATLTVDSTMAAVLTPANGQVNVCYDTPLFMAFNQTPLLSGTGKVNIYNVNSPGTPVDTIDTSLGLLQVRTIGTESFATYPVIITSNTVAIYPHLDVLSSNQQYYVTLDPGIFTDTNGALYTGITTTNGWTFTTKPTGPANPNNVVVAADESGDFATVQGAVDSLPSGNTTYTLVNIRNGTYTEIVDTKNKNHITFRGQSRTGTVVGYLNNNSNNGSTHSRMAFKVYANDLAIENMTVVNTTPQGGSQAEALMLEAGAARFILNNAEVDSRQDTIYANGQPQSQGYFYNSLVQGNYDYIWGGGNLFITNCQFQTIPTASQYNLAAPRTDNGSTPGGWLGPVVGPNGPTYASNGFSFVNCLLTRSSNTVANITMSDANGNADGVASWIDCHIDTTGGNGYVAPVGGVISNQILWEYGNSNLDNSASVTFGFLNPLTNGDARLVCASSASCWLYNWAPQLAPNILTNPVSMTVTAGTVATFSVAATGVPDPSYQWLLNGTNVINATANNATLIISNALIGDAGTYSVIVSNAAGTVTSSNATLTVVGTGPTASFMASPTSGTEPLAVTFTDTSSGSPNITLFWDFGDNSQATNSGGSIFVHTYAAGTYTVTLTASNAFGANSTLGSNDLIIVVSAFAPWQQFYGLTGPSSGGNASYTGDGMSNTNKFLAGFNPTNAAAYLHIISVVKSSTNIMVTYLGASGDTNYVPGVQSRTNVLDFTTGGTSGNYTNGGWQDTGQTNILGVGISAAGGEGTGLGTVTNMTDVGGAMNARTRYYRIRLVP